MGGGGACYRRRRSVLASPRYRYRPPPLWHEGRKMIRGTGDNGARDLWPCPGAAPLSGTAVFRSQEKEERRLRRRRTKEPLFSSSYFKTLDVFFRSAERGVWGRGLRRLTSHHLSHRPSVSQVITQGKTRALPALPGKDLSAPTPPSLTAPAFYFPTGRRKRASNSDRK